MSWVVGEAAAGGRLFFTTTAPTTRRYVTAKKPPPPELNTAMMKKLQVFAEGAPLGTSPADYAKAKTDFNMT